LTIHPGLGLLFGLNQLEPVQRTTYLGRHICSSTPTPCAYALLCFPPSITTCLGRLCIAQINLFTPLRPHPATAATATGHTGLCKGVCQNDCFELVASQQTTAVAAAHVVAAVHSIYCVAGAAAAAADAQTSFVMPHAQRPAGSVL
jgi:hypothetical protein